MAGSPFSTTILLQRWQRLKTGQRFVAAAVSGLVLLWTVDVVAFKPLRRRLGALTAEVEQTKQALIRATEADHNASLVARAFKNYELYAATSASAEAELAALLSDIETTVRQSGVVLLNLKPAPRSASDRSACRSPRPPSRRSRCRARRRPPPAPRACAGRTRRGP